MKLIVRQHKFAKVENANVDVVLLEHRSVVLTLMNVLNEFATAALFARTLRGHSNVFVLNKQLVIHTQRRAAYFQINVYEMKTALRIWLASKENAQNPVLLPNVDAMPFANQVNIKHSGKHIHYFFLFATNFIFKNIAHSFFCCLLTLFADFYTVNNNFYIFYSLFTMLFTISQCPPGHLGDPTDKLNGCFRVECISSEDCSENKYCNPQINKCQSMYF